MSNHGASLSLSDLLDRAQRGALDQWRVRHEGEEHRVQLTVEETPGVGKVFFLPRRRKE